jgi:hypothetical protein
MKATVQQRQKQFWGVAGPAAGAIVLTSLSSGMSQGPWAFAAGFGIGMGIVATLAGIVALAKPAKPA